MPEFDATYSVQPGEMADQMRYVGECNKQRCRGQMQLHNENGWGELSIDAVISEKPIPEPAQMVLLVAGICFLLLFGSCGAGAQEPEEPWPFGDSPLVQAQAVWQVCDPPDFARAARMFNLMEVACIGLDGEMSIPYATALLAGGYVRGLEDMLAIQMRLLLARVDVYREEPAEVGMPWLVTVRGGGQQRLYFAHSMQGFLQGIPEQDLEMFEESPGQPVLMEGSP